MICILGCLDTDLGLKICDEMLSHLSEHTTFVVHQKPPGNEYEYPAISKVLNCAITLNEPVLYVHTKGAGNKIPYNYKTAMMAPAINFPKDAIPEDCQKIVRLMWYKEFTGARLQQYLKELKTDVPMVICPFAGPNRVTWQNGWIINPLAAKELLKTFHKDTNRYYYENMLQQAPNIILKGMILNDFDWNEKNHKRLWDSIWSFYDKEIIKDMA